MNINIGIKIGKLTVIDILNNGHALCQCNCGNIKSFKIKSLKSQKPPQSCGCLHKEAVSCNGKKTITKNSMEQILINRHFNTNFQVIETQKPPKNNTSGIKGVAWNNAHQKWEAYISIHGKRKYLGNYESLEEAERARRLAEEKYYIPLINQKNQFKGK